MGLDSSHTKRQRRRKFLSFVNTQNFQEGEQERRILLATKVMIKSGGVEAISLFPRKCAYTHTQTHARTHLDTHTNARTHTPRRTRTPTHAHARPGKDIFLIKLVSDAFIPGAL